MPRALGLTAGVLALFGVVPGMPHLVFLLLAAGSGYAAWWLVERAKRGGRASRSPPPAQPASGEATWDDVTPVDQLGLEVGYRLIALVDKEQGGDLLSRIKGVRKKFATEVGFLPPAVHIRDNLELRPSTYRVTLKGVIVGEGEAFPGMLMAIDPGHVTQALAGHRRPPIRRSALPATWIDERQRELAQSAGYTVVDAATVIATHLHHLMQMHASRLLGRAEAQQLLEHLGKYAPKLAEDVVPKLIPLSGASRRCCRTCSTRRCTCATCAASSRAWPSTRCAPRIRPN